MTCCQASKEARLDLAEVWLQKLRSSNENFRLPFLNRMCSVLREIAEHNIKKEQYSHAIHWLVSTDGFLIKLCKEEGSYRRVQQLRLSLLQVLFQVPQEALDEDNKLKIIEVLANYDADHSSGIPSLMMKLEAFDRGLKSDVQEYFDTLMTLIRKAHITEPILNTIMYYMYKLRSKRADLTNKGLSALLRDRVIDTGRKDWIEKVLVLLVWSYVSANQQPLQGGKVLANILGRIMEETKCSVSVAASRACQLVSKPGATPLNEACV